MNFSSILPFELWRQIFNLYQLCGSDLINFYQGIASPSEPSLVASLLEPFHLLERDFGYDSKTELFPRFYMWKDSMTDFETNLVKRALAVTDHVLIRGNRMLGLEILAKWKDVSPLVMLDLNEPLTIPNLKILLKSIPNIRVDELSVHTSGLLKIDFLDSMDARFLCRIFLNRMYMPREITDAFANLLRRAIKLEALRVSMVGFGGSGGGYEEGKGDPWISCLPSSLHRLTLINVYLNDGDEDCLASTISRLPNLKDLILNEMDIYELRSISIPPSLRYLNLDRNNINCHRILTLAKALSLSFVSHVSLKMNKIGDAGLTILLYHANRSSLKGLNLSGNRISDAGISGSKLDECTFLLDLNLSNNGRFLEEASFVAISRLIAKSVKLETINLAKSFMFPPPYPCINHLQRALAKSSSLKHLFLDDNDILSEGIVVLARGLACNKSLRHLSLNGNDVQDLGFIAIVDAVRHRNVSLQFLGLRYNRITDKGLSYLLVNLDLFESVDLTGNSFNHKMANLSSKIRF